MCTHYGPEYCCVPGDSSGFCSNNDPENNRIKGAHAFVDSLRSCDPESQIGVLTFSSTVSTHQAPLLLNNDDNINRIHTAIEKAACETEFTINNESEELVTPGQALPKYSAVKKTSLGRALVEATTLVNAIDEQYSTCDAVAARFSCHIILLTDGAWDDFQDINPQLFIEYYQFEFSSCTLPTVHGIFIYDSVTHVEHGYPPQGCTGEDIIDLAPLRTIADLTGGMYFSGSTPENIIKAFDLDLCEPVSVPRKQSRRPINETRSRNENINSEFRLYDLSGRVVTLTTENTARKSQRTNGVFIYRNNKTEQTTVMLRNR